MTPALAAAYVAIAAILWCAWLLASRLRRANDVIELARACLLVEDVDEAFRLLSAPHAEPDLYPRLRRAGHL